MNISDLQPAKNFASGIYAISINDKWYVGSAINLKSRKKKHKKLLNTNRHPNKHLQSAYNKYCEFKFSILEYCEPEKLLDKEKEWIDWTNATTKGYNKRAIPNSNFGLKFSKETRNKMSMAGIGKHSSKRKPLDKEMKERLSKALKGKSKPHFRNLKRWPHDLGYKCRCEECRITKNKLELARLHSKKLPNYLIPLNLTGVQIEYK